MPGELPVGAEYRRALARAAALVHTHTDHQQPAPDPREPGVFEASLSALLIAFGLQPEQAIAATLLYRIISYWALQPIGWASWTGMTLNAVLFSRSQRKTTGGDADRPDGPRPPGGPGTA